MQCPTDGTVLQMSERSGIEIDYCPHLPRRLARPWRAGQDHRALPHPARPPSRAKQPPAGVPRRPAATTSGYQQQGYRKPKKKESWLSELFD